MSTDVKVPFLIKPLDFDKEEVKQELDFMKSRG